MEPRRLAILDINDKNVRDFRSGEGNARYFVIRRLRTWKSVQDDVGGVETFRPDIVLIDIDFDTDSSVENVEFQEADGAKPLGPMLALPYVASRAVWVFAVYSAHFGRGIPEEEIPSVMRSPWVIFPLGILFAKLRGQVFESTVLTGKKELGNTSLEYAITKYIPKIGNPAEALESALLHYRTKLLQAVETGNVRVTNGQTLRRSLEQLAKEAKKLSVGYFCIDEDYHLELYSSTFGLDRIQLLSLCADFCGFQDNKIYLEDIEGLYTCVDAFCGSDPVFQYAMDVIDVQEKRREEHDDEQEQREKIETQEQLPKKDQMSLEFDKVAAELYGDQPDEVRREILRIGVLLANVHGWAMSNFTHRVNGNIFDRLGKSPEGNTYKDYFGHRARTASSRVCGNSLKVERLEQFVVQKAGTNEESYYLEWGETILSTEDRLRSIHYLEKYARKYRFPLGKALGYLSIDEN